MFKRQDCNITVIENGNSTVYKDTISAESALNNAVDAEIIVEWLNVIPSYIFGGKKGVTSVTIGDGVTVIGPGAFASCSNLSKVVIGSEVTQIGEFAFARCHSLHEFICGENVRIIERGACFGCSSLRRVDLNLRLTHVGPMAFAFCQNLKSVDIKSSARCAISASAFNGSLGNRAVRKHLNEVLAQPKLSSPMGGSIVMYVRNCRDIPRAKKRFRE